MHICLSKCSVIIFILKALDGARMMRGTDVNEGSEVKQRIGENMIGGCLGG